MASRSRYALRGIASGYVNAAISFAAGLLFTPFAAALLGPAAFGLWKTLSGSLLAYLSLLELGLLASGIRFVASLRSSGDQPALNRFVSTMLGVYLMLALVALLISGGVALLIEPLLGLPPDLAGVGRVTTLLLGLQLATIFAFSTLGGIIAGYERYDILGLMSLIGVIGSPLLSAAALLLGSGVPGLALCGTLAIICMGLTQLVYIRRRLPQIRLDLRQFSGQVARQTLGFSLFVFALNTGSLIISSSDHLVIANALGVAAVAPYAIALTLNVMALQLIFRVSDVLLPMFTDLSARGDTEALRRFYPQTIRFSTAVSCGLMLAIIFIGPRFIGLWVQSLPFVGFSTLVLIASATLMQGSVVHPTLIALQGTGRVRPAAFVVLAEAALNLGFSLVLVRTNLGVTGVALATALATACMSLWLLPLLLLRQIGLPMSQFLASALPRPLLAAVPAALAAAAIGFYQAPNLLVVGVQGGLIVLVYAGLFFVLASDSDRRFVAQKLRGAIAR